MIKFLFFIVVVLFLTGCKKDQTSSPVLSEAIMGLNYYPTNIGKWVIYDVKSISIDSLANHWDTTEYQLKEIIESTYLDEQNRPTLRIERYIRLKNKNQPYDSLPWQIKDVWFGNLLNNSISHSLQVVEENQRMVKLVFPVTEGSTFNINAHNTSPEFDVSYLNANKPSTVNLIKFDSTVIVRGYQASVINKVNYSEVYAKHVGLISKVYTNINYQSDPFTNTFYITTAQELFMTVVAYSKN